MYGDKILELINKTVDRLDLEIDENPPFKIPERTLVILPKFIGDIILLTPLIRNLRYNFGNKAAIDLVCADSTKNILETLPYVDNIFSTDIDIKNKIDFLREKNYDAVFLFNFPVLWAWACVEAKIPQRVGFSLERIGCSNFPLWQNLLTHVVKSTPIKDKSPQWKVYLDILKTLGLNNYDNHTEIVLTKDDKKKAKGILKQINSKKPKILIQVIAGSHGKQLELSKWITILKHIKKNIDCTVIATGTEQEKEIYEYLSANSDIKICNLCGKTTIREAIALYKYLDLVITLDTSISHLAGVAGVKNIIIIYGPTNEAQWQPYAPNSNIYQIYLNLPCRPCITRVCSHKKCLVKLRPEKIINAIDKITL